MANWSSMKKNILIGSLSGPNFTMWTAKMDRLRIRFGELIFKTFYKRKPVIDK